jgi:hypothetical protein
MNVNDIGDSDGSSDAVGQARSPADGAITWADEIKVNALTAKLLGKSEIGAPHPSGKHRNRQPFTGLGDGQPAESFSRSAGLRVKV